MQALTGLDVAYEPGQWLIWTGCLLLTAGLMLALYLSHIRVWGVLGTSREGKPVLLLGGQPSKYRENFERKFHELTGEVETALARAAEEKLEPASAA
jgi:cytochrome c biogenesis protein